MTDKQKTVYDILAEKLDKDHGKDWRRDRTTVRTLQKAAKRMEENERKK